jgi:hypothetical protein
VIALAPDFGRRMADALAPDRKAEIVLAYRPIIVRTRCVPLEALSWEDMECDPVTLEEAVAGYRLLEVRHEGEPRAIEEPWNVPVPVLLPDMAVRDGSVLVLDVTPEAPPRWTLGRRSVWGFILRRRDGGPELYRWPHHRHGVPLFLPGGTIELAGPR